MENTTNKSARNKQKQAWNAANYTQIKISVSPEIAMAFKASCGEADISMAKAITEFMAQYCRKEAKPPEKSPKEKRLTNEGPSRTTRHQRRNSVKSYIQGLEKIKEAEEASRDNIPLNLQGSEVYENAEETISLLEEAIDLLISAY